MNTNQKAALNEKGLGIVDLARMLKKSRQGTYYILNYKTHRTLKYRKRICEILEKSEDFLWPKDSKTMSLIGESYLKDKVKKAVRLLSSLMFVSQILDDLTLYSNNRTAERVKSPIDKFEMDLIRPYIELIASMRGLSSIINKEIEKIYDELSPISRSSKE